MDPVRLTDEPFARIAPHLPTDMRGKERMDDWRVIGAIVHVLKAAGTAPKILPKVNRRKKPCFSPVHDPWAQCHRADVRPP